MILVVATMGTSELSYNLPGFKEKDFYVELTRKLHQEHNTHTHMKCNIKYNAENGSCEQQHFVSNISEIFYFNCITP